jgi:predicted transcriptional regulator
MLAEKIVIRFLKRQSDNKKPAGLSSLGHLETRVMAYTTVMTTLDRLYKKGLLKRRKCERAYLYSPRQSREACEQQAAADFVTAYLVRPHPAGELLISCLVDAVGQQDEKLLDELEKKIRLKRKELDRRGKL